MSFSSKAKEDLTKTRPKRQCCRVSELAGFLQLAGGVQLSGGGMKVRAVTESYAVARWAIALAKGLFNLESETRVRERKRLGRTRNFEILLQGESVRALLLRTGMIRKDDEGMELASGLSEEFAGNKCCRKAFLKGAFLGGGSASNPEKGYHLEFVVQGEELAEELRGILNEFDLNAKVVLRKGTYVVYLKGSEKISDFFALIGASGATLDLQNVRIYKDFRNNLNRALNCEMANLDKTLSASARQAQNIRYLLDEVGADKLPPHLLSVAEARINNPEATLQELSDMMDPPLGKSGVNHRLRKLDAMAQQHMQSDGALDTPDERPAKQQS